MTIRARILQRIADRLPAREIKRDGQHDYLIRYYVGRLGPITVYLHHFLADDGDDEVHDHPWPWSVGIPLVGWYIEERLTAWDVPRWHSRDRWIFTGRPNWLGGRAFHKISYIRPGTWTLFIHGRRHGRWGFLRPIGDDQILYISRYASHGAWWRTAPSGRELRERRRP